LKANTQNYEYQPNTGIHGMVFDAAEDFLYSADLRANKVWTHKKDHATGHLELVDGIEAPDPGDHPRWVAIHPSGAYLYVLMEAGNRLCEYVIDPRTHKPVYTHNSFPLIPAGLNPKDKYRADNCPRVRSRSNSVSTLPLRAEAIAMRSALATGAMSGWH